MLHHKVRSVETQAVVYREIHCGLSGDPVVGIPTGESIGALEE
jgi:hypothetical protein